MAIAVCDFNRLHGLVVVFNVLFNNLFFLVSGLWCETSSLFIDFWNVWAAA